MLTAGWDGTARVWDAASGEEKLTLIGHGSFVQSAVFSPDEKSIATAGDDRTVRLWSVGAQAARPTAAGRHHLAAADYPSFTPDGRWVLVTNSNGVQQLWDLAEGKLIRSWPGARGMIRPDGREIATALADGTIEIRETSTGRVLRRFSTNPGGCHVPVLQPRRTVARDQRGPMGSTDRDVVRAGLGRPQWSAGADDHGAPWMGERGAVHPGQPLDGDGRLRSGGEALGHPGLVPGTDDSRATPTRSTPWPSAPTAGDWLPGVLTARCASGTSRPAGNCTGCAGTSGASCAWRSAPTAGVWRPAATTAVTRLWDVNSGQEMLALAGHTGWVFGIAFSPDGHLLVSTSDDGIRVWDASPVEPDRKPNLRLPDPEEVSTTSSRGDR